MYKLIICDEEGQTTPFTLDEGEVVIGRAEGCQVRLDERNISRRHARLIRESGHLKLEDLDSDNGVWVNGERINSPVHVGPTDEIVIGDFIISVREDTAPTDITGLDTGPLTRMASADTAEATASHTISNHPVPQPFKVKIVAGPGSGTVFPLLLNHIRIGRASHLPLSVNHRSVSREHAEIFREGDAFHITDLESANGVVLNGEHVTIAPLKPGDRIELGQVRMVFLGPHDDVAIDDLDDEGLEGLIPKRRWPLMMGIGLLVIGAGVAGAVVTWSTGSSPKPNDSQRVNLASPRSALDPSALSEAVHHCELALSEERFEEAFAFGSAALRLDPENGVARRCRSQAEQHRNEAIWFGQGKQALALGDFENAYQSFLKLDSESPYRSKDEFQMAVEGVADEHLEAAKRIARTNASAATDHVNAILDLEGLSDDRRKIAEDLLTKLERMATRASAIAVAVEPKVVGTPKIIKTQNRPNTVDGGTAVLHKTAPQPAVSERVEATTPKPAAPSPDNELDTCVSGQDHPCVIRLLRGKTRSAKQLEWLIDAYRATGGTDEAARFMEDYVERYPTGKQANNYRQYLLRRGGA